MKQLTFEQQMRNVARILVQYTERDNKAGRRSRQRYRADTDAIAGTGRHLAEMVLEYLDAGGLDGAHGLDGEAVPAGVVSDDLPF